MTMPAVTSTPSPNHGARRGGGPVDMLLLHYTDMQDGDAALQRLCDPVAEVSAHYLIAEDGRIHRLVEEGRRAFHAGVGYWRGVRDVNSRSIGIELQNPGHSHGYRPFPPAQIAALIRLVQGIVARHPIPARNILGHSDTAPDRKQDPGALFPWRDLAAQGVGLWPEVADAADAADADMKSADQGVGEAALPDLLAAIGYDPQAQQAIAAFQRRFRPTGITNHADGESCRLAAAYLAACRKAEAANAAGSAAGSAMATHRTK